jgi:hypothetical protein
MSIRYEWYRCIDEYVHAQVEWYNGGMSGVDFLLKDHEMFLPVLSVLKEVAITPTLEMQNAIHNGFYSDIMKELLQLITSHGDAYIFQS